MTVFLLVSLVYKPIAPPMAGELSEADLRLFLKTEESIIAVPLFEICIAPPPIQAFDESRFDSKITL